MSKRTTSLVVLAGGASSRMKKPPQEGKGLSEKEIQEANQRSKSLISVGNDGRPMMDYVLYNIKKAGFTNIYIVIGPNGDLFKKFYGDQDKDNDFHRMKLSFAVQHIPEGREKPFGTADALYQAVEQYPELNETSYVVCNSDNLYSVEALKLLSESPSPHAFIAYDRDALDFPSERISRFALVELDSNGSLTNIVEKPAEDEVENYRDASGKLRVSMNIFKFDGAMMFSYLKNCPVHPERNEKELPTALMNMLADNPKTMAGIPLSEHVPDLTSKDDITEVKKYLEKYYPTLVWDF
ncbi:sugar phosphate nucleotidyltransferase [Flagellimonas sp.]|uniref:sugar phosphate nucleotidyltransferase n=1 Tax=Flagellimonas sp. TaxID=2058762 RepID=UPI003B50F5C8